MKTRISETEERKGSKKKETVDVAKKNASSSRHLSKETSKSSPKEVTTPKKKPAIKSSNLKNAEVKSVKLLTKKAADSKETKKSSGNPTKPVVEKKVPKRSSINVTKPKLGSLTKKKAAVHPEKTSGHPIPMGNMAPAAFSKAAFEEQVNLAIRESISRQKEEKRVYNPEITNKMKSIIANYTESPELLENIESNTDEHFVEKLNIDSVDFVEIIVDAEEAFQIKMEDEEIKALRSFDDLYDLIEGKINTNKLPVTTKA